MIEGRWTNTPQVARIAAWRSFRWVAATLVGTLAFASGDSVAEDTSAWTSVGPGTGVLTADEGTSGCETQLLNSDAGYEGGIAWQYNGIAAPQFGAFAECFVGYGPVCSIFLDLVQLGYQSGQTMDVYLWGDAGGEPGAVVCLETGVDPGPIAFWPSLSRHTIDMGYGSCYSTDQFWAGYWGNWPGAGAGWFVGTDLDGSGAGGCPVTNIAPGLGYPTGWSNVSSVWGPTQALGVGVEMHRVGPGACCLPNGQCMIAENDNCPPGYHFRPDTPCEPNPCPVTPSGACCQGEDCMVAYEEDCRVLEGEYLGDGTSCSPNPCSPVPTVQSSWGTVKESFQPRSR